MDVVLDEPGCLLVCGDALEVLSRWPDATFDALVTDPPSSVGFMGKEWDSDKGGREQWVAWLASVTREALRVVKPGGHGLVWALPRRSHWTAWALEDAGWEVRDCVYHAFGTGFPKSLDVSKAIDRAAGAEREVGAERVYAGGRRASQLDPGGRTHHEGWTRPWQDDPEAVWRSHFTSVPATEEARRWSGWGTALKPAVECWWLVRKPLSEKSVAANVLAHGTGALNVDACRVAGTPEPTRFDPARHGHEGWRMAATGAETAATAAGRAGRWPPHLALSHDERCARVGMRRVRGCPAEVTQGGNHGYEPGREGSGAHRGTTFRGYGDADGLEEVDVWACVPGCPVRALDDQGGTSRSRRGKPRRSQAPGAGYGMVHTGAEYDDEGGVSRFFPCFRYQPKPSRSERDAGLDHRNLHCTVKSIPLMRWLVRLITPQGGLVLDPFAGSGSTGCAALLEDCRFVGVEQDAGHCADAAARLRHWSAQRACEAGREAEKESVEG